MYKPTAIRTTEYNNVNNVYLASVHCTNCGILGTFVVGLLFKFLW